jgi:tetratricopeptide (TPR) repeat protein
MAAYRKAIEKDASMYQPWYNLGLAHWRQEQRAEAIPLFRKAVELNPGYSPAWYHLAASLRSQNQRAEAAAAARKAVETDPADEDAVKVLAGTLADDGKVYAAYEATRAGAERNPKWLTDARNPVRYNLACYGLRTGLGLGVDVPATCDRPSLRRQALGWFRETIAGWRREYETDPGKNATALHERCDLWLKDADLLVTHSPFLTWLLPAGELSEWAKVWAEVGELRRQTLPR